jgi:NAD(P)-dependent dehydrogenase (short-subunit alcohol dehydrogenase family)
MKRLEGKAAVVTGAASGIGKAIAQRFAQEGCRVFATDLNKKRLDDTVEEIRAAGNTVFSLAGDISSESFVDKLIADAITTCGTIDILVNCAGIMDSFAPVAEVENAVWERVFSVNVDGTWKTMRAALKIFLAKGSGNIINIASIGGLQGARAGAAYTASKFAVVGLTKNTGYMYSKSGIRCNAIAPGGVNTNIGETIDYSRITPLVNDRIMAGMPLNPRMGEPAELASAAVFLASDEASFVNGAILTVDGGWTAY